MTNEESPKNEIIRTINPLIFISHDTRDAKLAEAFSTLLKSVSAGVLKSFRTSDRKGNQGIEYGIEWYPEIIRNIQNSSDVVCLLTERSVERPWILFEAGMAKGRLDTPILGVALGVSLNKISGPFAQFQNCGDDEDSLTKLVYQLVSRIPNAEPDSETIRFQVANFKKSINSLTSDNNKHTNHDIKQNMMDNSSAKLFEEIKVMFQDLPSRIDRNISCKKPIERDKSPYLYSRMSEAMNRFPKGSKAAILMLLTPMKDKMPWLYEIGLETLKTLDSNIRIEDMKQALSDFEEICRVSTRMPMAEQMMSSEEDYLLYKEFPSMIISRMMKYMDEKNDREYLI